MAQWLTNPTSNMRLRVRSLALLSSLRIRHCCELWCRPVATAPTRPLAWEPPYCCRSGPRNGKKTKQKQKLTRPCYSLPKPASGFPLFSSTDKFFTMLHKAIRYLTSATSSISCSHSLCFAHPALSHAKCPQDFCSSWNALVYAVTRPTP